MSAQDRYDALTSYRSYYLDEAEQAADLTIPYLIRQDEDYTKSTKVLRTPWQSVGSKAVVTLASKLMLALLPPNTSFFKLQLAEEAVGDLIDPQMRTEMDTSFSKIEQTMMDSIAASSDRVIVHQAIKQLIVAGNALIFMGPDKLKLYPLNRFVVDRDGNGNVIEIVTKERVAKSVLFKMYPQLQKVMEMKDKGLEVGNDYNKQADSRECDIYTHVKRQNNRFIWYQEVYGKVIPNTQGKAPLDTSPWLVLRMNYVDGEMYGRGRVSEFMGDFKSLEALSQALVEGSAVAAKVVFVVSPSSTTKPAALAAAGNGAIVQGRPEDIQAVTVGKQGDFRTAAEMAANLERRLSEAFLIMQVRDSERTTAEEVRQTQLELDQQLGGIYSLLTVEFLVPYLNRKLKIAQKSGDIPTLPKGLVNPVIVAGVNALGRGQDRESLGMFLQTIAQTMGPEAIQKYINPEEVIKRLAASQGINSLNLVRTPEEVSQSNQQQFQMQEQLELTKQAGQLASQPMLDPSKNPNAQQLFENGIDPTQQAAADASQEAAPPQGGVPEG